MKFRLKKGVGTHAGPGRKAQIYKPGDIIESGTDLVEAFPNKFERVEDENPPTVSGSFTPSTPEQKAAVQEAAEEGAKDIQPPEPEEDKPNPLGRDVTHRFPLAEEEDFKVFADGGAFYVVEADDPTDALNPKPLKRKSVDTFIRQYLET